VLEKPTPTVAEQQLIVPGLRAGFYLCFFGMHVFEPELFSVLDELHRVAPDKPLGLSPALNVLATRRRYLALNVEGRRFDIGAPYRPALRATGAFAVGPRPRSGAYSAG
jgi:UTP--glucose-1-phosphate uridylyltransferase